jgi:hypothetical protein
LISIRIVLPILPITITIRVILAILLDTLLILSTLCFYTFALLSLALLNLDLTLLLSGPLLLLPGFVSFLNLLAALCSPNASLLFLTLLGLRGNGSGTFRTTLSLLLLSLSLSLLLILLFCCLPFLLFFLALLGSLLLSLFLLFTTAPLCAGVDGQPDKTYAAYRYRKPDSFNFFSFHGFPLYLKFPFARRDEAPGRITAIYIPNNQLA